MVNKVFLIGRLGRDPEVRYTPNGDAVANLSIAVGEKYKKDGETKEKVTWVDLVAWRKLAEVLAEHLHKGSLIHVEGKLQMREWEAEGGKRRKIEVLVQNVRFLDGKNGNGGDRPSHDHESGEFDEVPF